MPELVRATESGPPKSRLKQAKEDFLLAGDRYGGEGSRLSQATIEQLEPYYDRAEGRAAVIQRFAEDLADAIRDFDRVQPMLTELVAMLLLQTGQRGAVAGAEAIAAVGQQVLRAGTDPGSRGLSDQDLGSLDDLVALEDLAERIENEAAFAVEVCGALYALREDELRRYLAGVPHVSATSVLGGLPAAVAKEGTLQAVGAGLEALAKVAGTQVPVANAVMGA